MQSTHAEIQKKGMWFAGESTGQEFGRSRPVSNFLSLKIFGSQLVLFCFVFYLQNKVYKWYNNEVSGTTFALNVAEPKFTHQNSIQISIKCNFLCMCICMCVWCVLCVCLCVCVWNYNLQLALEAFLSQSRKHLHFPIKGNSTSSNLNVSFV